MTDTRAIASQLDRFDESRPSMRPLIGVTTQAVTAAWAGVWRQPVALSPMSISDKVVQSGGRPILIPPYDEGLDDLVARLDAVVLAGGPDVDPALYGDTPHERTTLCEFDRDRAELKLAAKTLAAGLPILGICRGTQILNVALGGTLIQHLPDLIGHDEHAKEPGVFNRHQVHTLAGSHLCSVVGPDLSTPTYHHQAVGRLGEGLRATAWAVDGTVEAVELDRNPNVIGVQWHPEANTDCDLFRWLVQRAEARQSEHTRV